MKGRLFEKFQNVLSDYALRESFHQYLQKHLTEEHLEFYLDVVEYKKMKNQNKRKKEAKRIFKTYLSDSATKPINVPNDTLEKVEGVFGEGMFEKELFESCKNAVCKLLVLDSLPMFLEDVKRSRRSLKKRKKSESLSEEEEREGRMNKRNKKKAERVRGKSVEDRNHRSRVRDSKKKKTRTTSVDNIRNKKKLNNKKERRTKSAISTRYNEKHKKKSKSDGHKKNKKKVLPLNFEEAFEDDEIKCEFYDYLLQTYSNEYLDFYEDIIKFQNLYFEDEEDIRDSVDKICSQYLGIGKGSEYLISVNFEVMEDFKERLEKKIDESSIFSLILSEAKQILKAQYHNYLSEKK